MTGARRSPHKKSARIAESRSLTDFDQAVAQSSTLRDCLRHACSRLTAAQVAFGHGTDNAWDEAVWLGLWSLHLPLENVDAFLDARLSVQERAAFFRLIKRRCEERLPAAYLTGEAWLGGLRFRADPRAIIPRSLIVEALFEGLDPWLNGCEPRKILDLCTGSGSIAINAALKFESSQIDACDLSRDALALAQENVSDYCLDSRIRLLHGDLFTPVKNRQYDLILCNPPYVNASSMDTLPAEFLSEPRAALAGGQDGMDLVRKILAEAAAAMRRHALLVLEIGHETQNFEAAFGSLEFT
ncbi:MAG: 50S ribosomal protein L3 N(5)-glutamine methyltransferase, partial [Quisquiliibacterium sp.]